MKISKSDRAIEEKFDLFCAANSFASILTSFNRLCALTVTAPTTSHPWNIYRELNAHVKTYWKGAELFKKLDKRVHSPDYMHQTVCSGVNALVIGCGPCGLRCAIELALLGARVVVVEKRDAFSRNNVLHLWPYLIEDLRGLGAKTFFGKFCVGSIDHVSIRTLQCILLKVALLFGVQIFPGVAYRGLVQPTSDVSDSFNLNVPNRLFVNQDTSSSAPLMNGHFRDVADHPSHVRRRHTPSANGTVYHSELGHSRRTVGWRVRLEPEVVALQNYEIDVLIGADGKRSCIGFPSKELRCRLAIAITANFVNYRTQAETEVEEISGVASIFNQQFFARLASDTGIDLENIVYYKDETHYFVMTACKHSLLAKGVLKQDREDSERLLCSENIDHSALQAYARETANYVTRNQLPRLDFAINARGQPDVDVFDFTRIFAAEYSCRMLERKQHLLMQCLVGDGLFEPFWPTGSGCALGFLSALDAAWAVSRLATGLHPLQVLAQRESVYQRLSQTTPQNMPSNFADYTIDPKTRYTRCNVNLFTPEQVRHLFLTDRERVTRTYSTQTLQHDTDATKLSGNRLKEQLVLSYALTTRCSPTEFCAPSSTLGVLRWFQIRLSFYESFSIVDSPGDLSPTTWESGAKLMCLIHLYKPELVPELEQFLQLVSSKDAPHPSTVFDHTTIELLPRACDLLTVHFGIQSATDNHPYPGSANEWIAYLTSVHRVLRSRQFIEPNRISAPTSTAEAKDASLLAVSPARVPKTKATNAKVGCPPHHRCVLQNGYLDASKAKRVFREDPNWSVEKGLLLKRRAELIATLQDPASTKRHLSVQPLLSIKKRPFVRNGSDRSKSPRLKQLTSFPSYQPEQRNPPTRSRSNHEVNSSAHQTSTTSTNTARLSGPRKGGGGTQCRMCNKRVYSIERVTAFGSNFHRNCLRCRVCDSQLQPENAVRARTATSDTFFCLAHSPLKSNGGSKEPRSRASSTGVSAADRLRAGPHPPDNSRAPPVQESQNRPSVLARAHALENPPAAVISRPSRRPVSNVDPSKSALLAGLSDGDDAVMGVVDVRALIRNFRGAPSDSSTSPSPVRRYVGSRKPLSAAPIGPSGDAPVDRLRAPGIRDEGAPGPDCFLAGHLGLPEVERRAIWELNTTIDLPDLSVSDLLEHMRSNRRAILGDGDYFASTESDDSHTACDSDALKTRVLPLPCKHKGRDSTTTVAPCNTHRTIESNITLTTMTTMNSSPALLSSQTSSVLDQTHPSSVMAAKRRFCMEPPKPLIIDPKQFISNKNRERTTTNSLSDCTEFTHPIQEVELLRRLTPPSNGSPLHSPGALVVRDLPLEATQVPLNSSTPRTSDCDVFDPFPNSHHLHSVIVSTPSPAASFAPLEQLRDIDSLSTTTTTTTTTTEHSSTERLSETDDLGPNISACPLPAQTPCLCPVVDIPAVDAFVSKSTGILIHPTSSEGSDVTDTSSADLDSAVVIRPIQTRAPSIIIQDERLPGPRSSPTEDTSSADCTQNDQLAPIVSAGQESSSSSLVYGSAHSMVGSDVRIPPMPLSLLQDSKIHLPKTSSEVGCACAPVFVKDFSQGAENLSRTHSLVSPDRPRPLAGAHSFSVPNLSDFLRSTNFVEPSESKVQC